MKILSPLTLRVQPVPQSNVRIVTTEMWIVNENDPSYHDVLRTFRDQIDKQLEEKEEK